MIKMQASTRTPVASWPRAGVPDFTFVVRSHGGEAMGTGIAEFDWTLQVESRPGLVSVESHRSDADLPGEPIGVFRFAIDDVKLREFHELLTAARLGEMRPAMKTHPGYTERNYTIIQPTGQTVRALINNSDEATNSKIATLRSRINALLGTGFSHPEFAARPGLTHSRTPSGDVFDVTVTNIGIEKICFADPRWIQQSNALQRAAVMVTEFPQTKPGDPPPFLDWKAIPLEPMVPRPAAEPLVVLDKGAVWKASVTGWKRQPDRRYLAYFSLANYAGQATMDAVYRIRGRTDSKRSVIEP